MGLERSSVGVLLRNGQEVDLGSCCLVAEVVRNRRGKEDELVAAYILAHDMTADDAAAACTFFHEHPTLLVDVDALMVDAGAVNGCRVRIAWTDETQSYLETVHEYRILLDIPRRSFVRYATWRTYVDYVMAVRSGMPSGDALARRLMKFDIDARENPDCRISYFAKAIVEESGEEPSYVIEDGSYGADRTLVVCPSAKAEDGRPNEIHKALASPLPLVGGPETDDGQFPAMERMDALRAAVPWMKEIVDLVEEGLWLSYATRRDWISIEPILIHGPSGCGKTHFCAMLAQALGVPFADISLAGSTDNRMMEGTALGWSSARPSWPATSIAQLRCANPLLFVDEVEKVDSEHNGDPRRTLLRLLDRKMAGAYHDPGLGQMADLSQISWIFAANEVQGLDTAFMDRVRVVKVREPSVEHLPVVVEGVLSRIADEMGVPLTNLPSVGDIGMRRVEEVFRERKSMRAVSRTVRSLVTRSVIAGAREGKRLI